MEANHSNEKHKHLVGDCCTAFYFLYMTLAVNIIDGLNDGCACGLSNEVFHEYLPKRRLRQCYCISHSLNNKRFSY